MLSADSSRPEDHTARPPCVPSALFCQYIRDQTSGPERADARERVLVHYVARTTFLLECTPATIVPFPRHVSSYRGMMPIYVRANEGTYIPVCAHFRPEGQDDDGSCQNRGGIAAIDKPRMDCYILAIIYPRSFPLQSFLM